jgi:predicted MarR family transcription regulator
MTYDLRRLPLHGLVERIPRTNTSLTAPDGPRATIFYAKVHDRVLGPLLSPDRAPAPLELRRAVTAIDHVVADYVAGARLQSAP